MEDSSQPDVEKGLSINFDWIMRLCDHARHHDDSIYLGNAKIANSSHIEQLLNSQPKWIYSSAWMLDACGVELGFEIIDTSSTMHLYSREYYEIGTSNWGFRFRWYHTYESYKNRKSSRFNKKEGHPSDVRSWGDPVAFERDATLLNIVLPLHEDLYDQMHNVGMAFIESPWENIEDADRNRFETPSKFISLQPRS